MTYLVFIIITGAISIIAASLLALKTPWRLGSILLPLLAVLFFAVACTEYLASFNSDLDAKNLWTRISVVLQFITGISLLELNVSFLGKEGITQSLFGGIRSLRLQYIWRPASLVAVVAAVFLPWFSFSPFHGDSDVILTRFGEGLLSVLFIYHLLNLYVVEKIFRNTSTIQKRIFTLFLASAGIISIGSMVLLVRILFYKVITFELIQIHVVLCSIFFPGMLIGLTRYRLWQEKIAIGRGMVYTSITILFFALFLIALGIIASAVRLLGIRFNEFEEFVFVFSVLFLGILTVFSPHMRKIITGLSRKYIYKEKYDYRDQLLRLHAAHQTTGDIENTVIAFIDNLRYTIIVKNAHIFLRSSKENSFIRLGESRTLQGKNRFSIRANSPLVNLLEKDSLGAIDRSNPQTDLIRQAVESETAIFDRLCVSHIFGIKYKEMLLAILCIDAGKRQFDSEDLMLITMFCESMGTAIFRDRIQRERIEQKQFESFSHMASFIVHDIKNQVATLLLVTKNAQSNIGNPDFHPVLLRSLNNCSENLSMLIAKLQSPPRRENLVKQKCSCNDIVNAAVEPLAGSLPEGITITTRLSDIPDIIADPTALSYILKNLLINGVEAVGKNGILSCTTGSLETLVSDDTCSFGITTADRNKNSVYIVVEDNGPGMSRDFLEHRLFKPFNTTKDKGIGIGLYQCKTLIETMNGRLYCWSEEGKGTRFCILL